MLAKIFLPQKNPQMENLKPPKNPSIILVTWNLEYPLWGSYPLSLSIHRSDRVWIEFYTGFTKTSEMFSWEGDTRLVLAEQGVVNKYTKYVRCTVRDSRIRSRKCLEAPSTLKYEPLNSCITVHSDWIMKIFNVMLLNACSRNKRRKNCEESNWRSQSAFVRPLAINRSQDLIGS